MYQKIKQKLKRWLFSEEELAYQARELALKQLQEQANLITLAREQLSGFDYRNLARNEDLVHRHETETDDVNDFLAHAHELYKNPVFWEAIEFLKGKQILHGQLNADSLQALNFSRATINGLQLLAETVEDLEGTYQARTSPEEDYNPHEVV